MSVRRRVTSVDDAAEPARGIVEAFAAYNEEFRAVTRLAALSFEARDWVEARRNAVRRIELYEDAVNRSVAKLHELLGPRVHDRNLWASIKHTYAELIAEFADNAFFKTFFSSITRRIFRTVGVDLRVEFAASDVSPPDIAADGADFRRYENRGAMRWLFDQVLSDFSFGVRYRDRERTIRFIAAEIDAYCAAHGLDDIAYVEVLAPIFYRSTRAYLVGRINGDGWSSPLVVAMRNGDEGIVADAVILSDSDVSMLFGYTRSYFHVDLENVGATVSYLRLLMPRKPLAEIYTVLGRARQGKTERYRSLFQHLEHSTDQFVHASGVKGMVMEVFTLPSYDVVFKVIRDRFEYPKTSSRADVMDKYDLVFKRDRAGRLVDAQEFRRLRFPEHRFAPELLASLLEHCAETCRIEDGNLVVEHAYIERRLVPLNIYLAEADTEAARAAAIDYGQAIRDLAMSNIFAGDLLIKNFGVSRHGRVIFYDYDELCLVTDCNFRRLPEPEDDYDELRADAWFYVGPNDVFPEQFIEFLGFKPDAKQAFLDHHADLLTATFWARLKQRLAGGDLLEVLPYTAKNWTEHRGRSLVPVPRTD